MIEFRSNSEIIDGRILEKYFGQILNAFFTISTLSLVAVQITKVISLCS